MRVALLYEHEFSELTQVKLGVTSGTVGCGRNNVAWKNCHGPGISYSCSNEVLLIYIIRQSLAMALYFASRGVGHIRQSHDTCPELYTSTARVLLNGLGSDELLGGYGRHRTAFNLGWQAVADEVISVNHKFYYLADI